MPRSSRRISILAVAVGSISVPCAAQQVQQGQTNALPPSPITRIEVTPRNRTVTAGDSIRLRARAVDAAGQTVSGAKIFFSQRAGGMTGVVDSTGMLVAGAVGKFPLTVTAIVPGTRPVIDSTLEIAAVPGPATRVAVMTKVGKLAVGQDLRAEAIPFSRANDRSHEKVQWTSSAPEVATVSSDGVITANGVGHASITASAGTARSSFPVEVVAGNLATLTISPARPTVRQGDVVHLSVNARANGGAAIAGLAPTWSFSPGDGQIESDGSFVAYRTGDYQVLATVGGKSATTVVHVAERNVRRPVSVVGRLPRTLFPTSEVWIHPNGKVAYLGTHGGGDRVYAIDISDPAKPVIVDLLPVPLNSSKITSSMRLPVSIRAVARIVRLPPSSTSAGGAEEALRLLHGVGVETAGEQLAAGRGLGVVGAGQAGDRVEQDDHVAAVLDHALGLFQGDLADVDVLARTARRTCWRRPRQFGPATVRTMSVTSSGRSSMSSTMR